MTFSIAARDPATGAFGVAVSTAVPCVGAVCPYVKAGVGAIASQSFASVTLGVRGLELFEAGLSPETALQALLTEDPEPGRRQWGGVDARGRVYAYSGDDCVEWFGSWPEPEKQYTVQGNMLVGAEVVEQMARAYEAAEGQDFAERLVLALEAGQAAGGDKRGRVSAALVTSVVGEGRYPGRVHDFNIRVDEHSDPVPELRRIFDHVVAQRRRT